MIDFSTLKALEIPEGAVKRIDVNGVKKWERESSLDLYQRVESLTTSGGTNGGWFFVEDFIGDAESGMELTYSVPTLVENFLMGSISNSTNRFLVFYPKSSSQGWYGWGSLKSIKSLSVQINKKYVTRLNWLNDKRVKMLDENGVAEIPSPPTLSATALTKQAYGIGICRAKTSTATPDSGRPMTIYSARLSKGSEVVREYLPCYRKSDGEIGLLDLVTKTFLPSQVSGGFSIGTDIEWGI